MQPGAYPVVGSNGIIGYHNEYTTELPVITVGRSGSVGRNDGIRRDGGRNAIQHGTVRRCGKLAGGVNEKRINIPKCKRVDNAEDNEHRINDGQRNADFAETDCKH